MYSKIYLLVSKANVGSGTLSKDSSEVKMFKPSLKLECTPDNGSRPIKVLVTRNVSISNFSPGGLVKKIEDCWESLKV